MADVEAELQRIRQESELGRCCRSILVIPRSSLGPYRLHRREDGEREVEVVEESQEDPSRSLLLLTSGTRSSSSLLNNYMHQETRIATLEKENNNLRKENNGLKDNYNGLKIKNNNLKAEIYDLKAKNDDLMQKILELEAKLTAPNVAAAAAAESGKDQNESETGLSYDELLKMNTVMEATYQTGQESDASSVDELTGQEPTLAELQSMNSVRD